MSLESLETFVTFQRSCYFFKSPIKNVGFLYFSFNLSKHSFFFFNRRINPSELEIKETQNRSCAKCGLASSHKEEHFLCNGRHLAWGLSTTSKDLQTPFPTVCSMRCSLEQKHTNTQVGVCWAEVGILV